MKQPYYFVLLLLLLSGCNEGEAVFNIQSINAGKNAVIEIYDLKSNRPLGVTNIINGSQQLKITLISPQYGSINITENKVETPFLIYLEKGEYELETGKMQKDQYPVKRSSSRAETEFIDYYQIKEQTGRHLKASFEKAKIEFDNSTAANVAEKSEALSIWAAKNQKAALEAIKIFAKKYPESQNTIFLLNQLGLVETEAIVYATILKGLSPDVQQSKAGQELFKEITVSRQMSEGSIIPVIEGSNPKNQAFDAAKIFKKVNLIICWTTYDSKSRRANPKLVSLYEKYRNMDVEFIGISYDKNRKWWTDVIRDDHLDWPQYTDLKGAKSPNAKSFSDQRVPYMLITDQKGKILANDIEPGDLEFKIKSFLK